MTCGLLASIFFSFFAWGCHFETPQDDTIKRKADKLQSQVFTEWYTVLSISAFFYHCPVHFAVYQRHCWTSEHVCLQKWCDRTYIAFNTNIIIDRFSVTCLSKANFGAMTWGNSCGSCGSKCRGDAKTGHGFIYFNARLCVSACSGCGVP